MTLMNRHPRTFSFAILLIVLLIVPFQTADAKKRHDNNARGKSSRRGAVRAEKGRKVSAKERRSANRRERLSARVSRRGGRSHSSPRLSRRELRRQSAREQAASLKALERRLHRPL